MQLEKGYLYHIYNQGNNQRTLFFKQENYLFFLKKIKIYVSPYADIVAWCLMPNHFHLMILLREEELPVSESDTMTQSHRITTKKRTLNNSIAILLRSDTRAINIQQNTSGSLFKAHTKAECINCHKVIAPSFTTQKGATKINVQNPERQYPQICFDYIHQNPVNARLVKNEIDWEFSSALDYANLRNGKLVNKEVAAEYLDF
ncbi:hypothetical protein MNBD_BACTEROID03-1598 [hydrothermal vent metagenome]|uniref:Transposase IS200-like domain-containing protein n=1 Tax=hydrothermal vent metagenome TaxID=652676 RepID=A0A3B0U179_9ZZZZ